MTDDGRPNDFQDIGFRHRPQWLLAVVGLVAAQLGLAAQLFGGWAGVTDDRPVVSGHHPLHQYHAGLGAGAFREGGTASAYDPHFQAGYPKTPVFDSAARVAEPIYLLLGDHDHAPAAYKIALVVLCGMVPLVFAAAGRGFGIPAGGTVWAAAGGCLVWWSEPVRTVFDHGHLDLLTVGLAFILFLGGLARYAGRPGPSGWATMTAASVVGWYVHPVAWFGLLPAVAVFYLVAAPRHGLAWHLGALAVPVLGLGVNWWWLADWAAFWWVRCEPTDGPPASSATVWQASEVLRLLSVGGWAVLALAAVGLVAMVRKERCGAAGGLIASVAVAVVAARLGEADGTDARHAAAGLPALLVVPAAFAVSRFMERMKIGPVLAVGVVAGLIGVAFHPPTAELARGVVPLVHPLAVGLNDTQAEVVEILQKHTTTEARVLIEESADGWHWMPLLAPLTGRHFIGGLDAGGCLEHSAAELRDHRLAGRPLASWSAADRAEYARRYNIGWVLCRTPEVAEWWAADPMATEVARFTPAEGPVVLFELKRPRSFVLSGKATIERMDRGR
ncbi:MAG: hypothetical protein MUF18_12190, partial [Fimbriiglobus sp.]|nr:hypothetical protein [Fimbriiglobus sp.]